MFIVPADVTDVQEAAASLHRRLRSHFAFVERKVKPFGPPFAEYDGRLLVWFRAQNDEEVIRELVRSSGFSIDRLDPNQLEPVLVTGAVASR